MRVKLQQIDGEPGAEIERNNVIPNAKQASLLLSVTEKLPQYQPNGYTLTQGVTSSERVQMDATVS